MVMTFACQQVARCWYVHKVVQGPGFLSTSPDNISSSFFQGAVRREGASSPTVPPPPLHLDTHSEEERGDAKVEVNIK